MSRLEPEPRHPISDASPSADQNSRCCISECPICDGGLCTVRVFFDDHNRLSHGLVICDECEAIWLQPNIRGVHVYTDSESPVSPVNGQPLFDRRRSRWANEADVAALGWTDHLNPKLSYQPGNDHSDA